MDADICCIDAREVHIAQFDEKYTLVPSLQIRVDENRSKQARVAPDDNAPFVEPHISLI
eukprot:TRINITY_DN2165_c0_g1_i1.p5 TRINITY_DN2165_c0_g1~~TRINITY_DN2165_c0_g1_i1.p5  ORF type:complete len:59 (-),score=5.77 TRINITY_DN2165_c0_g1_i1:76-252(-)